MKITDLITQLQSLYNSYDDDYKTVMGEPEIVIDVFEKVGDTHYFEYKGYVPDIVIDKTTCGTYDILNSFYEAKDTKIETEESFGLAWPFPQGGRT